MHYTGRTHEVTRVARYRKSAKGKAMLKRYWAKMREHPEWRIKRRCRCLVYRALKLGIIQRQPCSVCRAKAEAHHADYSKPLEVSWLCRKHHIQAHGLKNITT